MIVDVHTHYSPPTLLAELERLGAFEELPIFARLRIGPQRRGAMDAERVRAMDEAGVDVQVLSPGAQQPYLKDADRTRAAAAAFNDAYAELISRYPGRFAAFACLPLPYVDEALAELDRCLERPGFVGVSLGCAPRGVLLDDPLFGPLWTELDRRGTPAHIHPGATQPVLPGLGDYLMPGIFGGLLETAVAVARLVVKGVPARHPNVPIIVAALGGNLPIASRTFAGGLRHEFPEEYAAIGDVSAAFRGLYYDTILVEEPMILSAAREAFGAARLLLGSDHPLTPPRKAVAYVSESRYLSDDEKTAVLGETAAQLLGLSRESPALVIPERE